MYNTKWTSSVYDKQWLLGGEECMKKIIIIFTMFILLSSLSGCLKKAPTQELKEPICVVNISKEKLTINYQSDVYTFGGKPISDDFGSAFDIREYFFEMCEAGMICHQDPVDLNIRFDDKTPSRIVWSQFYYRVGANPFPKDSIAKNTIIDHIAGDVVLHLGNNISVLDSSTNTDRIYRIVRIICSFDNQSYEYYAIFDGWC